MRCIIYSKKLLLRIVRRFKYELLLDAPVLQLWHHHCSSLIHSLVRDRYFWKHRLALLVYVRWRNPRRPLLELFFGSRDRRVSPAECRGTVLIPLGIDLCLSVFQVRLSIWWRIVNWSVSLMLMLLILISFMLSHVLVGRNQSMHLHCTVFLVDLRLHLLLCSLDES